MCISSHRFIHSCKLNSSFPLFPPLPVEFVTNSVKCCINHQHFPFLSPLLESYFHLSFLCTGQRYTPKTLRTDKEKKMKQQNNKNSQHAHRQKYWKRLAGFFFCPSPKSYYAFFVRLLLPNIQLLLVRLLPLINGNEKTTINSQKNKKKWVQGLACNLTLLGQILRFCRHPVVL